MIIYILPTSQEIRGVPKNTEKISKEIFLPQSMAKEKYNFSHFLFSFFLPGKRFMEEFFLRSAVENGKYNIEEEKEEIRHWRVEG